MAYSRANVHIFEGKLYIQTGKVKEVSKQIHANPKVEICAFMKGEWLRVAGELVEDDRRAGMLCRCWEIVTGGWRSLYETDIHNPCGS